VSVRSKFIGFCGIDVGFAKWPHLAPRRSPEEIEDWNQRFLTKRPETEEHQKYFHTVRDGIDPTRTDITTWVDLLDMEEG
jgi:hypothetical protein